MTIDAASSKDSGKKMVQAALGGLVLAFAAILILNTINPKLTELNLSFTNAQMAGTVKSSSAERPGMVIDPTTGRMVTVTPGADGSAQFANINNPNQRNASASGTITVNGTGYAFISGGGGNGYIPPGTYTVTMNTNEFSDGTRTTDGFVRDGVGFAFNLNDAYDPRTGLNRSELRIHPDGNNPGTAGCIGLQGNGQQLLKFKSDLTSLIKANGGQYTITVGK